jgi:hypothetical protein
VGADRLRIRGGNLTKFANLPIFCLGVVVNIYSI